MERVWKRRWMMDQGSSCSFALCPNTFKSAVLKYPYEVSQRKFTLRLLQINMF